VITIEKMNGSYAKLYDLLTKQLQLLTQFLLITVEQTQILANDDGKNLLLNLAQRQAIISQVDDLLTELIPLWQAHAAAPYQESDLVAMHEEIVRLLREITALDEKNQLTFLAQMDFLREKMRRISDTHRGAGTYIRSAALFSASYVDERH
jgi:hypothetical protein